jgi:hypothetical protein
MEECFMKHVKMISIVLVLALGTVTGCMNMEKSTKAVMAPYQELGGVWKITVPQAKNFEVIGPVFVEAVEDAETGGARVTYTALLREAARVGGHDIVNIRIDAKKEMEGLRVKRITWYGSALAIRYFPGILEPETRISTREAVLP